MNADDLEMRFHHEMLGTYKEALERCDYRAIRYLQAVNEKGGLRAAKDLLRSPRYPEGLTTLWECGCLDISLEALAVEAPWRKLFTEDELAVAQKRLEDLGHFS